MRRIFFSAPLVGVVVTLGLLAARGADPTPTPIPSLPPAPSPPVDFAHLPWEDDEALTYLVSFTGLNAAEGTFVARNKGDHWEFKLSLASKGLVDEAYPFTGTFWCILGPSLWRSVEYGEYRFEPHRTIKERTRIDYAKHQGTREMWNEGKTKAFPIVEDSVDDVGTMLYHLRTGSWKPGDRRTYYVYESDNEKQGEATCEARETRAFGTWPSQPLIRIKVLPTVGTHRRGYLLVWMTDDARHLPLHAELEFRYGSFAIDLESVKKIPGHPP